MEAENLLIQQFVTFFPPATISIALGKIATVFALRTAVTSCKGIILCKIKLYLKSKIFAANDKRKLARKCTKGKMKESQKDINLVFRDTGS